MASFSGLLEDRAGPCTWRVDLKQAGYRLRGDRFEPAAGNSRIEPVE